MRGKALLETDVYTVDGITPAYAGKRFFRRSAMHRKQDHPRLCGEKSLMCSDDYKERGSPPPMRGKVVSGKRFWAVDGITPAYAGKRRYPRRLWRNFRDHPRLCGEKSAARVKGKIV